MMWQQNYEPVAASLGLSAVVAAIPILVLFFALGVKKTPVWVAAISALGSAVIVALVAYGMPLPLAIMSAVYGAAFGLFPIAWIVFTAILLYRLTVETGKFDIIKDSVGGLTTDRRLQALLIAFAFGAFIEGAAGFGTPVAVAAAMLAGLGFSPFHAAAICLLANTAPVAFGSLGIPVTTLANITGMPVLPLSAMVGRLSAMISLFIPGYLIVVMTGPRRALEVLPAIVACGLSFAAVQFTVSNYVGPELTDILSSLTAIGTIVVLIKFWTPRTTMQMEGDWAGSTSGAGVRVAPGRRTGSETFAAWMPYLLLVLFVLVWGAPSVKGAIDRATTLLLPVPALHQSIVRVPPVTAQPAPYAAVFTFNWLGASGTSCLLAVLAAAAFLRVGARRFIRLGGTTFTQLKMPILTIAAMLAMAYVMNYSGMTSTLGLALAGSGAGFPFFSATLGWLGVFLTGSDTSANALFGNLQVVTANALGLNPVLTAAVNSAAGVVGKMVSPQSIAVAVAATGMASSDEGKLFRFTLKHSVLLMVVIGIVSMLYAYVFPGLVPVVPAPTP
ncbi:MAG: lactate permease LctP family transporter [Acidobacteria bacterium]|nr:lactate permease LctP family transporter [Acidobacteriota bacterium]